MKTFRMKTFGMMIFGMIFDMNFSIKIFGRNSLVPRFQPFKDGPSSARCVQARSRCQRAPFSERGLR